MRLSLLHDLVREVEQGPQYPRALQFPVIDICNSQCQMCHIWQQKQRQPISPDEIRSHMSGRLFSKVTAVGLNGGEPTLRKDLAEIGKALVETLPALKHVNVITNGYNVGQVTERITALAEIVKQAGVGFDVMVSLDGYGDVHDRVRGKPGNFERCRKVIDRLRRLDTIEQIRIGCTIIKENSLDLHRLFRFCEDESLYIKYRIGIPHQRLYTDGIEAPYQLDLNQKLNVIAFLAGLERYYEPHALQRLFYRSLIAQLRDGAPRRAGCMWRHEGATISSRGEVLFCAVQSPVIGQLGDAELESKYFGARPVLEQIKADKCADCRHDYVGLPSKKDRARAFLEAALDKLELRDSARQLQWRSGLGALKSRRQFAQANKNASLLAATADAAPMLPSPFVICGWYGAETLGDKAILGCVVEALRVVDRETPIAVASVYPEQTLLTKSQMPELRDVRVVSIDEAAGLARSARAVIFGGGPLMGVNELAPMRRLFELAKEGGRPTAIAGCGVGPLRAGFYRDAVRHILELADLRIFRDLESRDLAASMMPRCASDGVTADPAVSWVERNRPARSSTGGRSLLLGLREFPWREYGARLGPKRGQKLIDAMGQTVVSTLGTLLAHHADLTIRPVPMCTNPHGSDDRWYYQGLFAGHPEMTDRIDWSLVERELAPRDYLQVFADADAALAMRFHSAVFSLQCGIPTVTLDYTLGSGKVASLAKAAGVEAYSLTDLRHQDLAQALDAALARAQQAPPDLGEDFVEVFSRQLSTLLQAA